MEVVEIRVHGVHGTSPGTMLGVSDGEVGRVAGDSLTGLYRVKAGTAPYRTLRDGVNIEAYSWGALTSSVQGFFGWLKRALWLVLLPFALVNLAYWARLDIADPERKQRRVGAGVVRMASVLLTVFIVLTPCVLALDLVAWQCFRGGVQGCSRVPSQLGMLAEWQPSQRLAAATVAPMLVLLVLWLLSRTSLIRYEDCPNPRAASVEAPTSVPTPDPGAGHVLRDSHLWNGIGRTLRLQRIHLAAGTATVVGFSGLHAVLLGRDGAGWYGLTRVTTIAGLVVLVLAFVLSSLSHPTDLEHRNDHPASRWQQALRGSAGWLTLTALGVYAVHLLALWRYDAWLSDERDYWGRNVWFIAGFLLLTALILLLFVVERMPGWWSALVVAGFVLGAAAMAWRYSEDEFAGRELVFWAVVSGLFILALNIWHGRHRQDDAAWRGASSAVILAASAWVALLFTSSAVIGAADYLNGGEHGVGDLISSSPSGSDYAAAAPRSGTYVAGGEVVVRDANIVIDPDEGVIVRSGSITADHLAREVGAVPGQRKAGTAAGYSIALGTSAVTGGRYLSVTEGELTFEDSCLITPGRPLDERCTAEDGTFRAGGVLDVPDGTIRLVPGDAEPGRVDDQADDTILLASADPPQQPLVIPQVLIWTPMGQLLWLVLVAVALLWCIVRYRLRAGQQIREFLAPPTPRPDHLKGWPMDRSIPARDAEAAAARRVRAGLVHRAERLLDVVGRITVPVAMGVILLSMTGKAPWQHVEALRPWATISMYVAFATAVGLVALGSQIRRSENTRRAVGVIWDLTTFWPRAAHPLAPPCYAERVVPELITRVRWVLEKTTDGNLADRPPRVVLSGHSQGSLIVAAAASRLEDEELGRVRVVTYGSQIRALYGRIFPGVLGPDVIGYEPTRGPATLDNSFPDVPTWGRVAAATPGSLRGRLESAGSHWVNFFRRTDPLGWRVFSDHDSRLDVPVAEVPLEPLGDPGPALMTHSGYQHTRAYRTVVCEWTEEALQDDPAGTGGLTVLPPV